MTKTLLHLSEFLKGIILAAEHIVEFATEFLSFIGVTSVLILAYGLLGIILWTMMWGLHYLIT